MNVGDKVGRYEITALLGKGGMGEVFRARDAHLKREVAIKTSTSQFDQRVRREAEAVAALNHPSICTLHDVGPDYLVMEFIEGESPKGPMPLEKAFAVARQIGAALEHAHAKGIVHRDLKPANVIVRADGTVKVLDFGLAKVAPQQSEAGAIEDTMTLSLTQAGAIVGTAAYMSPEQAAGQEVDKRTDIWAFGVVFYELLTGQRLFKGDTVIDTLAQVRMKEPDWDLVPAQARRMLEWCLQKDPAKRLRDIADVWALEAGPEAVHREKSGWVWKAVAGLAAMVAGASIWMYPAEQEKPVIRSTLLAPEGTAYEFVDPGSFVAWPALSPDGKRIVFGAHSPDGKATQLWVRELGSETARPLPGTDAASYPFWSPDSRHVGFSISTELTLKRIDVSGGPPVPIATLTHQFRGASWSPAGVIVFSQNSPGPESRLMKIAPSGGEMRPATALEKGKDTGGHRFPWFLPDGQHFLYTVPRAGGTNILRVGSLADAENPGKVVGEADSTGVYSQGHLMYLRSKTLMAQPFDAKKLETTGEAQAIAEGIPTSLYPARAARFSVSSSGMLVYPGTSSEQSARLVWKDRSGQQIGILEDAAGPVTEIQFSPDRKKLLASLMERNNIDLWIYDVEDRRKTHFTFDAGAEPYAVWAADGRSIVWRDGPGALFRKPSNGGKDGPLFPGPGLSPRSVSRDNKTLLVVKNGIDIWTLPLEPGQSTLMPRAIVETHAGEDHPQFSPDGKWIAYTSDETKTREAYVLGYPGLGGKQLVSSGGASHVRWRSDGRELYYVTPTGGLVAAEITPRGETLQVGRIQALFGGVNSATGYMYDVSPDGKKFIVAAAGAGGATVLTLVQNWTGLLSAKK